MDNNDEAKKYITGNIKSVYKTALDAIELRFGREFEGFKELRKTILRSGNDAVRKIEKYLDDKSEGN